jgi:hypothetical protein
VPSLALKSIDFCFMTEKKITDAPIDAVIAWVDGNDPRLVEKRNRFLAETAKKAHPGAHPTRFASINEIKYCVLSILRFAPFVRNIFIVTDGQDPKLNEDIKKYFPERENSIRIVDHTEIFEGYEKYLPTFNSISIAHMVWRIKGLSENFVYFNDDTFLVKKMSPADWFIDNKPVLHGKWVLSPFYRTLWDNFRVIINKFLLGNADYKPRASFHLGQWNSAALLGFKLRYFKSSHTPHTVGKKLIEDYFKNNEALLLKNISFRFRELGQFTFIALSNHLQILARNKNLAKPGLVYMQPFNRSKEYIDKKIKRCENHPEIKYMCVQSLEMSPVEEQQKVFSWLEKTLGLN